MPPCPPGGGITTLGGLEMHLGSLGRSEGLKGRGFAAAHSWTAPPPPACLAGAFPVGAVTHARVRVPFRPPGRGYP